MAPYSCLLTVFSQRQRMELETSSRMVHSRLVSASKRLMKNLPVRA